MINNLGKISGGDNLKRKMIIKKIAIMTLSAIVASNFIIAPNTVYAYSLLENTDQTDQVENEAKTDGYTKIGGVESYKESDNKVTIKMTTGEQIRVSFLDNQVFRLYMDPEGKFQEDPTPNGKDHITKIIDKAEDEYEKVTPIVEDGDIIRISTDTIELRIEKVTGKMELFNKKTNKSVWKESEPLKYKDNETVQTLETNDDEYFYGGGMQNGRFSHKGKTINIKNENNWVDGGVASPTPFYFSTNGYGVMRNTFKPGQYEFSSTEEGKVITKHEEKRFDAYYFIEEKPADIINEFTELTGKPILLPEYGFYLGNLDCYSRDWIDDETGKQSQTPKPGYNRQETLMVDAKKVLDTHIENDMPLGYFLPNDGYGCGYGREDSIDGNINNLKEFVDYTKDKGVQTGLWTQSTLKPTGKGEVYLERDIEKEVGVSGTNAVKTDVAWVGAGYSFALNSVRQAAEGIENNSKDKARSFVVSLDGWAGTQRYAGIWSGDQSGGDWEYIRFHIPTYIGSGLSGQPNVASDVDGIFGGGNKIVQTRDFQWKAFTPIELDMDGWGSTPKNPYANGEPFTSINRMYLKLKAEMMPYNYSIGKEAINGMPMVRAMMLEYPDAYTYGTNTQYQYMWGSNMLVAPIYQNTAADENGNDIRNEIYLPDEEQIWIDYFTGEQYRGGGVLNNFEAPVWKVPIFIKNGAIIPMNNENNTPENIDDSKRIYEVYPSGETSFDVYEDDGLTTDYKNGELANTLVTSSAPKTGEGKAIIKAGLLDGSYKEMVKERSTEFIVNVSKKPTNLSVKVGNKNVELTEAKTLEEFEARTDLYFYDETPNLNKYATEGSDFAAVEIATTPKVYVKVDKTDVTKNEVELTINDFVNTREISKNEVNTNLNAPTNFNAPEELITPRAIELRWDAVEGATSYDVEIDGTIFKNITKTEYKDINVEFDTVYNYRVRSVNDDGFSEWSKKISPRTSLDPYRNVPEDMTVQWTEGHYGSSEPSNAVDNDDKSDFHSAGNAIDKPFIVDMKKAYQIENLDLMFRNNGNGSVKRAEIYSSLDGVNYQKVFTNATDSGNPAWATDGRVQKIEFDKPIKARYFKIVTKESIGNFMTMNEFRPYKIDGSNGQVVGDWNNSGAIEEGDLVFLENYVGLTSVDADWDYVSMADLNQNNVIDAYDISYVTSKLEDGVQPSEGTMAGEIMLVPSKKDIKAGENFTLDVVGTGLSDVNAFSVTVPLDSNKYELVKSPEATVKTVSMKNLSKVRVHSDNSQDIYTVFSNIGNNTKIEGTDSIARITLKAKTDVTFDMEASHALIVDSKLNSKEAIANIVSLDTELPAGKPTTSKIVKESITVTGDESQLQTGMGLNKLIDGTTSSDDSSRMDFKWVYNAEQVDKGTLPFEMTFNFNEAKEMDNFTIYHRVDSNGKNNIASMKKVKAVGYLNGGATELGEVSNITTATTVYKLNNKRFDKIVITALESGKDINTLAVNEIEFYEKKGDPATGIEFVEETPTRLYENKITPIFAKVLPDNANNLYYRLTSEDTSIVEVIRVDSKDVVNYYLRDVKPGTTKVIATTADGKFIVEKEITVGEGLDKELLIKAIEDAKSNESLSEIYTADTYADLIKAIEDAENVLDTANTEAELASAINSLKAKINALKERDTIDDDRIDFNRLEAIDATSEADSDFKENAVDGDENTIWHSGYQSADILPVSITIKLDESQKLNQIDYMPRQTSINGHITEYKVETSLDNVNWTVARTGSLKAATNGTGLINKGYNPIRFNSVDAQYVRFTALKTLGATANKYASIAELRFYGQENAVEVDKSELTNVINETEKLIEVEYTAESFALVKESLTEAKALVENESVTQIQVNEAIYKLQDDVKNLVKVEINIVVSKVENLKVVETTQNTVALSWDEPKSLVGLTEYVIYKDGKEFAMVPAISKEFLISELKANTIYGFKVTAKYSNELESKPQSINIRTKK